KPAGRNGKQVVLGAARPLGRAVLELLCQTQSDVRGVILGKDSFGGNFPGGVEVVAADVTRSETIDSACHGAEVIYDCFEPSMGARKEVWAKMTSTVMLSAIQSCSTVVFASFLINSAEENLQLEADVLGDSGENLVKSVVARLPQLHGPGVSNPLWK